MIKEQKRNFIDAATANIFTAGDVECAMLSVPGNSYNTADYFGFQSLVYTHCGVKFVMIAVRGGMFLMGNPDSSDQTGGRPAHCVTLSDYAIGQTLVTQELWQMVMGSNPSYRKGDLQLPVESVKWNEICGPDGFLHRLNTLLKSLLGGKKFVLPTEAQWEYAAAGGQAGYDADGDRLYRYSGSKKVDDVAWHSGNSNGNTHLVKLKQPNQLGLYDMSGNVWEWCSDWYAGYSADVQTNPTGAVSGISRVVRGGSYLCSGDECRVSLRHFANPHQRFLNIGFRLAAVYP